VSGSASGLYSFRSWYTMAGIVFGGGAGVALALMRPGTVPRLWWMRYLKRL
jgi:hypothetical protein